MQHTTQIGLEETDSMTSIKFTALLLFLLFQLVRSQEPDTLLRAEGSTIEIGYCFGEDYILVYRSTPEGDQLLGNSSNKNIPNVPPADLQGRTEINEDPQLLGLQISNLTHLDSGIYKRECWQNQTRISQYTQQLTVCNEEIEAEEIIAKKKGEGAEVLCNSPSIGLEGTSVHWYYEMYPFYKLIRFLDTNLSSQPFADHPGVVQVRDGAARLMLNDSVFENNLNFYCLVIKGPKCLSFQNMYPPDNSRSKDMFVSQGERVVLSCPADGEKQQWETPHGTFNAGNMGNSKMHISVDNEDFSMVIPVLTDEHSGYYSCISVSQEVQYSLALCPKISQQKVIAENETVSLQCDFDQGDSQQVQWHRHKLSGQSELICDSHDVSHPIPEDLRGRLNVTGNSSVLTISKLHVMDGGLYWCIVIESMGSDNYDNVFNDGDDGDDGDDVDDVDDYNAETDTFWLDIQKCTLKQETDLIISKTGRRGIDLKSVPSGSVPPITADPPPASNTVAIAVAAGVVVLIVVAIVIIVLKKRAKASPTHREAASSSGIQMDQRKDPGCTDSLTNDKIA